MSVRLGMGIGVRNDIHIHVTCASYLTEYTYQTTVPS